MFSCIQTISYSIKWDFMNCKLAEKIYHPNAASVSEALFLCKIPLSLVLHFLSSFPLTAKRTTYFTVSELCFWRQITSVNAMSLRCYFLHQSRQQLQLQNQETKHLENTTIQSTLQSGSLPCLKQLSQMQT